MAHLRDKPVGVVCTGTARIEGCQFSGFCQGVQVRGYSMDATVCTGMMAWN